MATPERRYGPAGGLTLGGILVLVGIVVMFVWSFLLGLIIVLVGLIAFGGSRAAGGTRDARPYGRYRTRTKRYIPCVWWPSKKQTIT